MSKNSNVVLEVNKLKIHFFTDEGTVKAVNGIDFCLEKGKTLGIIGESGCGKSVSAHSILRLIPSPPGKIVNGEIIYHDSSLNKDNGVVHIEQLNKKGKEIRNIRTNKIGIVFQEPMSSFCPHYTIGHQVAEAILIHNDELNKEQAHEKTVELLKQVGIPKAADRINDYPHQFSGGMRQRAMIAMALSCDPEILIADEPTTSLDVTVEAQILELLEDIQAERGMAIMLISHNLAVVSEVADWVAVMYLGKVMEKAPVGKIINNPLHPYTKGLISSIPKLEGELEELQPIKGIVPNPIDMPLGCPFAPRCERKVSDLCDKEVPAEIEIKPQHYARCFIYSEEVE